MTEETYEVVRRHVKVRRQPLRAGRGGREGRPPAARQVSERSSVRSVHVTTPGPDVTEACALIVHGGRGRALALRFEAREGRWLCTAVELG